MKVFSFLLFMKLLLSVNTFKISKIPTKIITFYSFLHFSIVPACGIEDNIFEGEQLFSSNCAACHAGGNNVIYSEKTLRKESLVAYLQGGYSKENIVNQITYGRKAMPPFMDRLNDEEIKEIAEYVYKMAENNSW